MQFLRLRHEQVAEIIDQARSGSPFEICGLIAGQGGEAKCIIQIPNAARIPAREYNMQPDALLKAYRGIESQNLELLAVYHSHPQSDSLPSNQDIRDAALNMPNVLHLIVGLKNGKATLKAWRISSEQIVEAELLIGKQQYAQPVEMTHAQKVAIVLAMLIAAVILVMISVILLPPAPPIPAP